jgi:hypothetical protein
MTSLYVDFIEQSSAMDNKVKGSIGSQNRQYKGKNFEDKNKRKKCSRDP